MKLTTILLTVSALALAQTPAAAPKPAATKPAAATPAKSAKDKVALEEYLRNTELWVPQVTVKIDDGTPSKYLPGFSEVVVHLSYNGQGKDEHYYVSTDGIHIIKGTAYDITKSPFQENLDKLHTDLQPSFGEAGAQVVIVVFGDFQCPYCKAEAESLRRMIPMSYKDKVRVYFKDFPLDSIHPWARPAAIAGRCVFRQDPVAFWKYHDWAYAAQQEITLENFNGKLSTWAPTAGLDALQLSRCVDNKQTEAEVNKNAAEGLALGVDSTPTLFINGRKLQGSLDENVLRQLIEIELQHQATAADAGEKCCTVTIPSFVK